MSNLKLATTSNKTYLNKRSKMKLLHLTKLGQWSSLIDTCVWGQLKPYKFARSAYETKNIHGCPFRIWGNAWLMWQHVIYKQCSLYSWLIDNDHYRSKFAKLPLDSALLEYSEIPEAIRSYGRRVWILKENDSILRFMHTYMYIGVSGSSCIKINKCWFKNNIVLFGR